MRYTHFFLTAIVTFFTPVISRAQVFDSASYVAHYQQRLAQAYNTSTLTAQDKLAGLSRAWAEARYNFANFDLVPLLNWDSLYYTYIPQAMAAKDLAAYYGILQNFYQHLRDGHSSIMPPQQLWDSLYATLPVKAKWVEGKAVITQLLSHDPAYQQLQPGTVIETIDGMPVQERIRADIAPYLNFSTPQDSTARIYSWFLFGGPIDRAVTLGMESVTGKQMTASFRRLGMPALFGSMPLLRFHVLPGNIGYLQLNSFEDGRIVAMFDSIFPALSHTSALIIDIRNNGGGNGNNGFEILGCLTSQPFMQGRSAIRHYIPPFRSWNKPDELAITNYDWKPYKGKLYNKPVAVLIGPDTYSAAEDFLVAFKSMQRGKLFGETTGGSTGQPIYFSLPGGGMGRVCAKRDMMADGTEFVGRGIAPDFTVQYTVAGIRLKADEAVQAAVNYLLQVMPGESRK
ncbi:MAG: S41 family peptidase [Chitinophagaceae bacterium]|jgi:C-terminal processing protease CtpA/Prc|nr:S41 family peptidase [Chitinophagaceae bacterium]